MVVTFVVRRNWRRWLNLEEALEQCRAWRPPPASRFSAVHCQALEPTADTFASDLAAAAATHALVATHGAGAHLAFFLPAGSALVEALSWDFCGYWPWQYFQKEMERDHVVESGYFKLVADAQHTRPGPFELNRTGSCGAFLLFMAAGGRVHCSFGRLCAQCLLCVILDRRRSF